MYELLLKSNTLYILSEILSSIYVHWWFFCHIVFSLRSTTLNDIHLQQAPRLLIIHDNGKVLKELLDVKESVKFPIWRDEECSRKVESVFNGRQFVKRGVYRASKKTDIDLIRSITIQNNSQKVIKWFSDTGLENIYPEAWSAFLWFTSRIPRSWGFRILNHENLKKGNF